MQTHVPLSREASGSPWTQPRVVENFCVPYEGPLTENEGGWVELIRIISGNTDPRVTLKIVQVLRQALTER